MPSSTSGRSKLSPQVYSPGSGCGVNTNPSWQDEPPRDELREQRWEIFWRDNRELEDSQVTDAFNKKFGYT